MSTLLLAISYYFSPGIAGGCLWYNQYKRGERKFTSFLLWQDHHAKVFFGGLPFGRYNLRPYTDVNSVICKLIVGGLASLFVGGGICRANDGGSIVLVIGHSPSHGLRRAIPLIEGAKKSVPQKRRKRYYEGYRNCSSGGRFGENRHSQRN